MKLVDSHCHIHDKEFFGNERQAAYDRAISADVGMITVGTDENSSSEAVKFARKRENIWVAVGVHPHDAKLGWAKIEDLLKDKQENKIVAIGEIGLDYFYDNSPRETQKRALEAQLQLALDYNLPVSFHVRNGFDDFWPIFDNFSRIRGVLHSFTDNLDNLEKGLSRGLLVGINGIVTFTKDQKQRDLLASVPVDKIIIETDAPFLTPSPYRGKINEPAHVRLVADYLARIKKIELSELASITNHSVERLFFS